MVDSIRYLQLNLTAYLSVVRWDGGLAYPDILYETSPLAVVLEVDRLALDAPRMSVSQVAVVDKLAHQPSPNL